MLRYCTEVARQTCYLTQSQSTDTGTAAGTDPAGTDPMKPDACQGSQPRASFAVTDMTRYRVADKRCEVSWKNKTSLER